MVLWVLNISKVGTDGSITLNPKKIQITTQHGSPPSEDSNMDREVATSFQQCTPNGGHVSLMCTHFFQGVFFSSQCQDTIFQSLNLIKSKGG